MICRTLSQLCLSLALVCDIDRSRVLAIAETGYSSSRRALPSFPQPLRIKLLEDLNASPDFDDPISCCFYYTSSQTLVC